MHNYIFILTIKNDLLISADDAIARKAIPLFY